jgi:AraC-like DNA-binding protein
MSHPIDPVDSRPALGSEPRVEARRARPQLSAQHHYHRIDVHLIVVADEGTARMAVDFTEYAITPGTVVWVRPGQVYRWLDVAELGAIALVFPAGILDADLDSGNGPASARTCWHLTGSVRDEVLTLAGVLERAPARQPADPVDPADRLGRAESRHVLTALALRLLRAGPTPARSPSVMTFARFRAAVDDSFAERHAVAEYATALGYSTRTLSRSTRAVTGYSPKQVIDARILLEARRLLAHTRRPVGGIGLSLGFDDPSNFASWFSIRAGCTPSEFRAQIGRPSDLAG